jgi:hypothetical protein
VLLAIPLGFVGSPNVNIQAASIVPSESAVEPIAEILGRVCQELDALANQLQRVQGLISPLVLQASSLEPGFLQEIQAVDHIEQKLACLSRFLSALAPFMHGHWVLDTSVASEVVTLSELARRLRAAEYDVDAAQHESGDFEMF